MPYCPKCHCQYAAGVPKCLECEVDLVAEQNQRRSTGFDIDFEELLVPAGAVLVLIFSLMLLGIRYMAVEGLLEAPLGPMIAASQPQCFVIFYVVAAVLSTIWIILTLIRWIFRIK
jgi:hypothetical protein